MPARIRLQRHGRKAKPFYHIVIADGRAPRDGRCIEVIGTYNPVTNPAEIKLDTDKALQWLQNGAQPSDTVKAILSYKGVIYKNHLLKGVAKGALTLDQAEAKFQIWFKEKETKIENNVSNIDSKKREELKKRLDAENKVNDTRAEAIAKKRADELAIKEAAIKAKVDAQAKAQAEKEAAQAEKEAAKAQVEKEAVKAHAEKEAAKAEPEAKKVEEKPVEKTEDKAEKTAE